MCLTPPDGQLHSETKDFLSGGRAWGMGFRKDHVSATNEEPAKQRAGKVRSEPFQLPEPQAACSLTPEL